MVDQVRIRITAEDAASKPIGLIKGQLAGLASSAGVAGGVLGGALAGGVFGAVSALGDMAVGAAQATWDLGVTGAQAERTATAFDNLAERAGISSQAMLSSMKAASRGTIADTDLMMAANRALVLDVADSAGEMGQLVAAAIARGREVGVGATQAVNALVTSIGRMSPEILDDLGIANAKGAFEEYALTLGVTADKLTEVEKKQALVNAVLASTQGVSVVADAASAFERMDASIQNAQAALGVLFSPAIAAIAEQIATAATVATDALTTDKLERAQETMDTIKPWIRELAQEIEAASTAAAAMEFYDPNKAAAAQSTLQQLQQSISDQIALYNENALAAGQVLLSVEDARLGIIAYDYAATAAAASTNNLTAAEQAAAAILPATAAGVAALQAQLIGLAAAADTTSLALRNAFLGATSLLGVEGAVKGMTQANVELARLRGQWLATGKTATEIEFLEADYIARTNQGLADQRRAISEAEAAARSYASNGVKAIDQAYSELESKVSNVLQGALQTDVSVEGASGYQNAINENARRLAAIANEGFAAQPWLEEFRNEVGGIFADLKLTEAAGGDVRAAAAALFQDFQAGLVPELIDKDMAKERVKRMILGEQSMAALSAEIAAELAQELGISLSETQSAAQSALGVKPTAMATDQAGDGAAQSGQAQKFVSAWVLDMNSQYTRIYATGVTSGEQWGSGFLTSVQGGVPAELISLLTVLITPEVLARIRTQQTQTGALP